MKHLMCVFLVLISQVSCSSYISAVKGYASVAVSDARATEDLNLEGIKFNLCATPFSAILRNPEYAAAIEALCVGNSTVTPSELLNTVKK